MLCTVLRSDKRQYTYIYLADGMEFDELPEPLRHSFGAPQEVMRLDLEQRQSLANANIETVRAAVETSGFYLQMPPETDIDELLNQHSGG